MEEAEGTPRHEEEVEEDEDGDEAVAEGAVKPDLGGLGRGGGIRDGPDVGEEEGPVEAGYEDGERGVAVEEEPEQFGQGCGEGVLPVRNGGVALSTGSPC